MGRRLHPCGGSQEALIAASQMPRPTLLRRLVPSSLAGQIILVVAIALFVAQAINFTLLLRERERQRLTVATAPAVARIIDAIERRSGHPAHSFGGEPAQDRKSSTARMRNHEGKRRGAADSGAGAERMGGWGGKRVS